MNLNPNHFTFHSGYILIGAIANINMPAALYIPLWLYSNAGDVIFFDWNGDFTFHSGYILIMSLFSVSSSAISLHSTLVIF